MKFSPFSKRNQGFTLVEIIVVVGIIGVISTSAVITYTSSRQRAYDMVRLNDLMAYHSAFEQYYAVNEEYPWGSSMDTDFDTLEYIDSYSRDPKAGDEDPIINGIGEGNKYEYHYAVESASGIERQDFELSALMESEYNRGKALEDSGNSVRYEMGSDLQIGSDCVGGAPDSEFIWMLGGNSSVNREC